MTVPPPEDRAAREARIRSLMDGNRGLPPVQSPEESARIIREAEASIAEVNAHNEKVAKSVLRYFLIGGALLFALLLYGCTRLLDSGGGPDRVEAFTVCQQFVEQRLKAPGSADFPAPSQVDVAQNGNEWTVAGYVDAENSFGAPLRSDYVCVVRYDGDDNWTLVSLSGLR